MASLILFTLIIIFPFLIGVLLIFGQILYQKRRHNNFSPLTNSLIHHQNLPHYFSFQHKIIRPKNIKTSMDEKREPKPIKRRGSLVNLTKEEALKQGQTQKEAEAQSTSPKSPFKKSSSTRLNCLCSPTTHVGSFRCRLHRHGEPGFRRGHSVGADLSELANKFASKPSSSSSTLQMH